MVITRSRRYLLKEIVIICSFPSNTLFSSPSCSSLRGRCKASTAMISTPSPLSLSARTFVSLSALNAVIICRANACSSITPTQNVLYLNCHSPLTYLFSCFFPSLDPRGRGIIIFLLYCAAAFSRREEEKVLQAFDNLRPLVIQTRGPGATSETRTITSNYAKIRKKVKWDLFFRR